MFQFGLFSPSLKPLFRLDKEGGERLSASENSCGET